MENDDLDADLRHLISRHKHLKSDIGADTVTINKLKRELYSDIELLRLNILDRMDRHIEEKDVSLLNDLDSLHEFLKLDFVQRRKRWYDAGDDWLRLTAVWLCLITFASTVSLPLIALKNIHSLFVYFGFELPHYQLITPVKQLIARLVLQLSGISLSVDGMDRCKLGQTPCIVFFSHASSMDAFILAATIPVHHFTLAKKELFLIPFFSWLLVAFGGVPIDRNDRSTAVKAIKQAAESASVSGDCIAIAPEGTRSVTGQLIAFKKGPFYLYEEIKLPIVPLIIFGAFDLYPPGKHMTLPGRVYVRYLDPIVPDADSSREAVSRLVRRKMLSALKYSPEDVGRELHWQERLVNLIAIGTLFTLDLFLLRCMSEVLAANNIGLASALLGGFSVTVSVTALLYVSTVLCPGPFLPKRIEAKVGKTD